MSALRNAVKYLIQEERDRQAEARKEVQKAVTALVQHYRSDDPLVRDEQVRRFEGMLLPAVRVMVLDKLVTDALHGSASLQAKSIRVLGELGSCAVVHLHRRLARSKQVSRRLRLLALLEALEPRADFEPAAEGTKHEEKSRDVIVA